MNQNSYTNRLIHESSPYLLQHAHNPVDWYPWGEEALNVAKKENKLILVSIGYAACHWCHVMERESFEDVEVAKVMNENFVCIKVDREERPDIDQIYMDAVQLMSGQGGWPLNCFAAPDGSPVYGGTYFQKYQWVQILSQLSDVFKNDSQQIYDAARKMKEGIKDYHIVSAGKAKSDFKMEVIDDLVNNWKRIFDTEYGGNNYAPKFPTPVNYLLLLRYNFYTGNEEINNHLNRTLKNMAWGGIYDQVGGGFCRYSTDRFWKVPHFEKMLYDNAQLLSLYSEAYRLTGIELYKEILEETIAFLTRELKDETGMFYSSLDADSEGVEGKFYVWSYAEFMDVLNDFEAKDFMADYFNVQEQGNWEGSNILFINKDVREVCEKYNLKEADAKEQIALAKKALMKRRNSRVRPGLDDKIITSWNALLISGLADSYKALKNNEYREMAVSCGYFIKNNLWKNGGLYRIHKKGKTTVKAFLEDYASLIIAMSDLYEITLNEEWLNFGNDLLQKVLSLFYDKENGFFIFNPHADEELFSRKMDISDTVIPSSNALMAKGLIIFGKYYENLEYLSIAEKMVSAMEAKLVKSGTEFTLWASLYLSMIKKPYEVAILSEKASELSAQIHLKYFPDITLAASDKTSNLPLLKDRLVNGETRFYLCRNNVCSKPVETVNEALKLLEKSKN